jgi:hypothetical protein
MLCKKEWTKVDHKNSSVKKNAPISGKSGQKD